MPILKVGGNKAKAHFPLWDWCPCLLEPLMVLPGSRFWPLHWGNLKLGFAGNPRTEANPGMKVDSLKMATASLLESTQGQWRK